MPTADFTVPVPEAKGKICRQTSGGQGLTSSTWTGRTTPRRSTTSPSACIGRLAEDGVSMYPNENFFKFFPARPAGAAPHAKRAPSLHAGPHIVFRQDYQDYRLDELLRRQFGRNAGLVLDLACYMIALRARIRRAALPSVRPHAPSFSPKGCTCSATRSISGLPQRGRKSRSSAFSATGTPSGIAPGIYVSYDSTNKNLQAGDTLRGVRKRQGRQGPAHRQQHRRRHRGDQPDPALLRPPSAV